jgi:two-component system, OmpR family, sensor histidine kinase PhoQ
MKISLQARLLLTASIILAAFVALTGLALEQAFRDSAKAALNDRLEGTMFALLAATEVSEDGKLSFSRALPDPRFKQPASGLYALVKRIGGNQLLKTPSMLGTEIQTPIFPAIGDGRFQRLVSGDGTPIYSYSFTANWDYGPQRQYPVGYFVAEDLSGYRQQITRYRRSLWGWLGAAALLLLLAQGTILRWSLKPLRQVERELADIEAGRSDALHGNYPRELSGLTRNLNALISTTREQLQRYRDALSNVSHSLKTPLTVLRGTLAGAIDDERSQHVAVEQLNRMQQIIDYHLQRASAAGRRQLIKPVPVRPVSNKVIDTLQKSYAETAIEIQCAVATDVKFYGDEGDLYEIIGNLLDNAFKWCHGRIHLTAENDKSRAFRLQIEDDGPGIPPGIADSMLERGRRADSSVDGYGIGLAMVHEIVLLYGGTLEIGTSRSDGAAINIHIPYSCPSYERPKDVLNGY